MRRHWRKTAIAVAGIALVASAVGSTVSATTSPPSTEPAGTAPATSAPAGTAAAGSAAAGGMISYDESDTCGTEQNTSNVAKLGATDQYTFVLTLCASDPAIPAKVAFSSLQIYPSEYLSNTDGLINNP